MKLLVQQFLETHSLQELQEQHGVYASFSKSGHKASFNYDQIEAKESDPLSQECRGLILSSINGHSFLAQAIDINGKLNYDHIVMGETRILSFPMRRFFNHGQGAAAEIDWADPNLAILEKMDGTLCIVYYDWFTKVWCVATRSVPEADLLMDNGIFTFRTLFEKALEETTGVSFNSYTDGLNSKITYCFELTTPYNRIVVSYPNNRVTLLSARRTYGDHAEFNLQDMYITNTIGQFTSSPIDLGGVPIVESYSPRSISELAEWVSTLNPMEHEGVVICDSNFNRIKVKNAAYVAASKIRDQLATSPRNCLELILLGKDDDAAPLLPQEIQVNLSLLKERFVVWLKKQEDLAKTIIIQANSIAPDKKTFALTVQKYQPAMASALFAIYDGKADSIKSFIEKNRKDGTWSNSFLDKLLSVI